MLVAGVGAAIAFAANWLSPSGLALSADYFPKVATNAVPVPAATNPATGAPLNRTNPPSAAELLATRLKAEGLRPVDTPQAAQMFRDPRRESGLIVFIDARNDEHYQAGHIPGAYQLDHYELLKQPAKWLAELLPVCQAAQQIVVYCSGGDCEDSRFAALDLRTAQVPKEKLFVYLGGFADWSTNGLPVEIGARLSGRYRETTK